MKIRFATTDDSVALLQIYAQYIDTPITFECTLPTELEFADRMKDIISNYPYLVCEENQRIIGYAYAHRQKEREAYQWNAELSVYIDKEFTSKGIGRKMYTVLIELLKLQGIKTIYGAITVPNEKSQKLHLALGFKELGTYHNTGYKCGKWHDVAWYEKTITSYETEPAPILSINEIEDEKIGDICRF